LGIAYLLTRPAGKILGSLLAGWKLKIEPRISKNIGLALLPQADVAIGMSMVVKETHPELGHTIEMVILSSILIYEAVGPFLTRYALARAGEIRAAD